MSSWLIPVLGGLVGTLGCLSVWMVWTQVRDWNKRRGMLDALEELDRIAQERVAAGRADVLRRNAAPTGRVAEWIERVPQLRDLDTVLMQAGLGWTAPGFLARSLIPAVLSGVVCLIVTGNALAALVVAPMVGICPLGYVRRKRTKRLARIEAQLPGAIDLLSRVIRAGQPLSGGLKCVAEETPDPLGSEFRTVFEEQRFGLPFEDALLGMGDRIDLMDVRILITGILVQREVGGNLTEILDQIAHTMRARFTVRRQVRVHTAQGRMSGYTLAALPVIVGSILALMNPDYMSLLFDDPRGKALLFAAGTMQVMGFLWIRKIVDVRY